MTNRRVGEGSGAKPLSVVARDARGQSTGQQAIWDEIRKQRRFTVRSLWLAIEKRRGGNIRTIKAYLFRLQRGGYIRVASTEQGNGGNQIHTYALDRDNGVEAPRLTRAGEPSRPLHIEQLWRSMRILGEFSFRDLAVLASTEEAVITERTARRYARALAEAGYLAETQSGRRKGSAARWRFIPSKYTGPKPPMLNRERTQVFDQNTRRIVWTREGAA